MDIIKNLNSTYEKAVSLIKDSPNEKIRAIKDYVATKFEFELLYFNYIGAIERKKKEEPLEVLIGKSYVDFLQNGGEYVPTESLFTALHELYENALLLRDGNGDLCPKANALACLTLNNDLNKDIKKYIYNEWGYVSYFPDKRTPEGRFVIEFSKELADKFNIDNKKAYIYLRANTLLTEGLFNITLRNPKKYGENVKCQQN